MRRASLLHQCRRRNNGPFPPHSFFTTTSASLRQQQQRPQQNWEGYLPDSLDAPLHSLPIPTPVPSPAAAAAPTLATSSYAYPQPASASSSTREETLARASIVFGTKLGGPAVRPPPHLDPRSTLIAGVHVPPKPEEPDNCCMSGCAHCVWDRWREEMELWAEKSREADEKLAAAATATASSAEGRGETGSGVKGVKSGDGGRDELFRDIPVGIREFMRLEKKLKAGQAGQAERAG